MVSRVSHNGVVSFIFNGSKVDIENPNSDEVEAVQLYNAARERREKFEFCRSSQLYMNAQADEAERLKGLREILAGDPRYSHLLADN